MKLDVLLSSTLVGKLANDPQTNQFSFAYSQQWIDSRESFPISPLLPVHGADQDKGHSSNVRQFFENLLPEGQGLEATSTQYQVSKSNLMGLLIHLGKDLAGALSVEISDQQKKVHVAASARPISKEELSQRIRNRPNQSFAVWDGKVRMSIAGFQDKIVAFEHAGKWAFVDGSGQSSNIIIKPEPLSDTMAGMTGNEFMCMTLSKEVGLPTASVRLDHVPEPVLIIDRFDRQTSKDGSTVKRLHVIDGCQSLGISPAYKYERPYGDTRDVKHIRDGASLPKLFAMLDKQSNQPAAQRLGLLRWVIFQIIVGNTDAHAKNLSFYCGPGGLALSPTYDILCAAAFDHPDLDDAYAMAIGDAFTANELTAYEWAVFADRCGLSPRLVQAELKRMCESVKSKIELAQRIAKENGVQEKTISAVTEHVVKMADLLRPMSSQILQMHRDLVEAEREEVGEPPRG